MYVRTELERWMDETIAQYNDGWMKSDGMNESWTSGANHLVIYHGMNSFISRLNILFITPVPT